MKYYGKFNQRYVLLRTPVYCNVKVSHYIFYYNFVLQNKHYLIEIVNSF